MIVGVAWSIRDIVSRLGRLRCWLCLLRLVGNPLEGPCGDEAHDQEVLATEAFRMFPCLPIPIRPLKRDIEHRSFAGFLPPDARTHGTMPDFLNGLL